MRDLDCISLKVLNIILLGAVGVIGQLDMGGKRENEARKSKPCFDPGPRQIS